MHGGHPLVTVEADPVAVEARLTAGGLSCPGCRAVLRPWGWARPRSVHGLAGTLRPRRVRCSGCLLTHVLLPVTVLLRRGYAAEVVGAALSGRAGGEGHRRLAGRLSVPAGTVRGWLRRVAGRLGPARQRFLQVAHRAAVDLRVPESLGCPWRDLLAALGAAAVAVTGRFGPVGVLGPVTAWQVAVACSGGRLLAPGWPAGGGQHESSLTRADGAGNPREGHGRASCGARAPPFFVSLFEESRFCWWLHVIMTMR
jgi:hypothetical protein